ncbi:unnamed protein product, partial [marine sediment metagenome]
RDIFYLEINEILEFADCDDPQSDLQMKVKARKDKENQYRDLPAPPDRFETYGEVGLYIAPDKNSKEPDKESADFCEGQRRGLGCSIGNVRGVVRVVHDPRNSQFQPGEILVAQSTDPGWILLFPLALGIIVERGSPLSHSAIVSRELGIPAVVALQDATSWLQDGDTVELNGETGFVTKC